MPPAPVHSPPRDRSRPVSPQHAESGLTQPHRRFEHRVEHRREVAGRGVDDLQHLGGRGLLLQGLARLGQQPRVLDRDNRLVGKGAHQFDLAFAEGLDSRACERDDADRLSSPQQGDPQIGTNAADCRRSAQPIFWVCRNVRDMHDAPFESGTPGDRAPVCPELHVPHPPVPFRPHREGRSGPVNVAVAGGDQTIVSTAQAGSSLTEGVEHRLQIKGRAADDLEHIAGRGLVFERFFEVAGALAQFAEQPRVLDRNYCLCGEILQQCDLFVGKRPHRMAVDV